MIWSTAGSLVLYGTALTFYLTTDESSFRDPASPSLWIFVLVLMFGVILGNLRGIAMATAVTLLVPEDRRDRANGLVGTASGVSFLVTSVISGLLVGLGGMHYVLYLAAGILAAGVIHLSVLRVPGDTVTVDEDEHRRVDLRGTLRVVQHIPGLFALIIFTAINNLLGGVFMALVDPYGLSLVSVEVWGLLWGFLSSGFIIGGLVIAKKGLGRNPLRSLLLANLIIWVVSSLFTIQSSIVLLTVGMFVFMCVMPYIEASEQTVLQKVVPYERQGRVFGFAQSVEQSASPLTAFLISPVAQFLFIPFMTDGSGADLIGTWYGTGPERGLALLFTIAGLTGVVITLMAMRSRSYRMLSDRYLRDAADGAGAEGDRLDPDVAAVRGS